MARSLLVSTFILYFCVTFAIQLLEVPVVRLFENAICDRYYRSVESASFHIHSAIDEKACKISGVQDELAKLVGWKVSFDALPGLLAALWYGSMGDRYGRQIILTLSLSGSILALLWVVCVCAYNTLFPPRIAWLSSMFLLLGGGIRIFNSIIFAIISDISSHSHRTRLLYLLAAGPHVNRLIAPRIATTLMNRSLYAPFVVALGVDIMCLVLINFISSPILFAGNSIATVQDHDPDDLSSPGTSQDDTLLLAATLSPLNGHRDKVTLRNALSRSLESIANAYILFDHPTSRFCLAAYFLKRIAFASEGFMFQYASEKFSWPLHQTTWLRVSQACGAITATLIVCPLLTFYLSKRGVPSRIIDLSMIRSALLILMVSFFSAWQAPSAILFNLFMIGCGLGEGLEPSLQGLVTYIVNTKQTVMLFSILAVCDTVAELIGGPLTAAILNTGRKPGHASDGFCFLNSSIIFGFLLLYSFLIKAKAKR